MKNPGQSEEWCRDSPWKAIRSARCRPKFHQNRRAAKAKYFPSAATAPDAHEFRPAPRESPSRGGAASREPAKYSQRSWKQESARMPQAQEKVRKPRTTD